MLAGDLRYVRSKDLPNSKFPENTLINIRTPERPDNDHRSCVLAGDLRYF